METTSLARVVKDQFAPETTYLDTASRGLLPRRAAEAVKELADELATGSRAGSGDFEAVEAARAGFARLAGVDADRVAVGGSVAAHVGLIAASLPAGTEVVSPEGEFSSVVSPFAVRGDLKVRYVPLEALADAVRPGTALVAFSSVQSSDGRVADLDAVREAAAAHGAGTLLDTTQSAGWLAVDAGAFDYTVTGGFKFLLGPRGTSFLTVTEEAQRTLPSVFASWAASDDPWDSTYGPVGRLSDSARRYDEPLSFLSYHGARHSLALLGEVGADALHAHATGLAARFREGLAGLGLRAAPGESAIVAVPGLGVRAAELARAGVVVSERAGSLRAAFHLYNTEGDVDRALDVLAR
ncbi:aminotransferase class V-fold PLP-dependent enzyme [Streptomyces sp. PTD5-9]|uniref:aminotransferase class V-fold PLP-dependent enzyme n=1 Tax=Streptomyces sp. PTD5-9 TaxID=3120150 RepID=UPI003009C27A